MDTTQPVNPNVLLHLNDTLEDSGTTPYAYPENLPDPSPEPPTKPHLWKSYASMLNSVIREATGKRKELTERLAWRCDVFLPSGELCNTTNGLASNRNYARKYCIKCARARTNPYTIEQEIIREKLIEQVMDFKGLDYAEATRELDKGREK